MVMEAAPLFTELKRYLEAHHIPDAGFDLRCMFEQVTGKRYEQLLICGLSTEDENPLRNMAQRRAFGEPLQYILGEWEFFGMRLFVGKGVLIPRQDTETLVETVLAFCREHPAEQIADLCTGSGCIALALQKQLPRCRLTAVELNAAAMRYAEQNRALHHLPVELVSGDVTDPALPQQLGEFDVIVSNPPYLDSQDMAQLQTEVRFEPESALYAGEDGLHFYREITRLWKPVLRPGGLLAYEIGETQGEAVSGILREQGFAEIRVLRDPAGHDRVVTGIKTES